jgi:ABC-type Co2+ transport system permease subunit
MQHSATLKYDTALVNQAVRAYWRRSLGLGVLIGVPIICVILGVRIIDGDRSWVTGLIAGAALVGIGMPILVYWVHYRNSMAKFRDMREPVATFVADDDSFTLASDKGSSTLRWDSIKEVWGFEGFWLLLFSKAHFATIPIQGLSEDMRAFVLERVKANGGQVAV